MVPARGALAIEYGHRLTDADTGNPVAGIRKQSFLLPIHVTMEGEKTMVFTDRMGHRASMIPGGAIQILPLDF